jgi:hypothetical protein
MRAVRINDVLPLKECTMAASVSADERFADDDAEQVEIVEDPDFNAQASQLQASVREAVGAGPSATAPTNSPSGATSAWAVSLASSSSVPSGFVEDMLALTPAQRTAAVQSPALEVMILKDLTERLRVEMAGKMNDSEVGAWRAQVTALEHRLDEAMSTLFDDGGAADNMHGKGSAEPDQSV